MNSLSYDRHNPRVAKAKVSVAFDSAVLRKSLWLVAFVALASWVWLVFFQHNTIGHLLLIGVGVISTFLFWYYGELVDLQPSESIASTRDIANVLDRKILAQLKPDMSPYDLAVIVAKQPGGFFYASRFGVGPEFLQNLSSKDPVTTSFVWQSALQLSIDTDNTEISSAAVVAGLVLAIPGHDTNLAYLKVDSNDIAEGLRWYSHIDGVIKRIKQRRNFGGIGRDLSFGWAPIMSRVGLNITESIERGGLQARDVDGHTDAINQMVHLMSQPGRRNAVLVGDVGVGKTTIVSSFAEKLLEGKANVPKELQFRQVVSLDAANLIANAKGRGQLEELLIHVFNEVIAAKNIIVFLDEAQLFLKDGTGAVDLSNLLLPIIEGGAMPLIMAITEQEWLRLSQTNPGLAQLMNRVAIKPLPHDDVIKVMEDQVLLLEGRNDVVFMQQALNEAYRLSDRFIHEQAFPGKAIKLLEAAAGFAEEKHFITAKSVQQAVEKSFDVKVQTADTFEEKNVLLNLEDRIHERMINQTRAVKLVSDALRRARAGVRNENKPIGTFLFLGPTGVGKTELSKALAAVYFGGEKRMVRVDLNEYSRPSDTSRLLAAGATDPYSLCAQVSKQPFSVVLLDEIEKAHPNVLNLLLQMLDEGVLRDTANKPVSFKDAIIIATSNAGAEKIREHISKGQQLEQFESSFIDELITANIFRPEFLNRFDETVLFRPLTQEELLQVVDLLLGSINKTLAGRKVSVTLTPAAKKMLAAAGYDPRLGARPLRRVMQRAVENLVAQQLLAGSATPGQVINLDAPELQAALTERS
jgi:ATP-dependent Clp protease ATP-binding subunit ClpC